MAFVLHAAPFPRRSAPPPSRRLVRATGSLADVTSAPSRPRLILAPMEVVADRQFRAAIAPIGGMDEAVHEFMRVTRADRPSIRGALSRYDAREMGTVPLAAQIMGGEPDVVAAAARELAFAKGAHRIDLNCGCPARRVNGNGAGASLLREPESLYRLVRAMARAVEGSGATVSVKMRSGYEDAGRLEENLKAVVEGGAAMVTLHPRTKVQGYSGEANWELIREAKRIVGAVPLVGNGDVGGGLDAVRLLKETGCDHVMVGRGAVKNPWIFWEIRQALWGAGEEMTRSLEGERQFYVRYLNSAGGVREGTLPKIHRSKIGRLKMLVSFSSTVSEEERTRLLRYDAQGDAHRLLDEILRTVSKHYDESGANKPGLLHCCGCA